MSGYDGTVSAPVAYCPACGQSVHDAMWLCRLMAAVVNGVFGGVAFVVRADRGGCGG